MALSIGERSVGAAGAGTIVVKLQAELKALVPALFVALTFQEYVVPLFKELTTREGELSVGSSTTVVTNAGSVDTCSL